MKLQGLAVAVVCSSLLFGCPDPDPGDNDAGLPEGDAGVETDAGQGGQDGGVDGGVDGGMMAAARTAQTHGSAIALAPNGQVAVGANRSAESIAIFNLTLGGTPPTASRVALLPAAGEPWAAIVANDSASAYVILRKAQQVVRVTGLGGTPALGATAQTGAEPTGIAISPNGTQLYVANWAEGTVTVIATSDMSVVRTVDLNPALAQSGFLGTVSSRPGLAHPRALVVTNDGDGADDDETVFVTEFFSQTRVAGSIPADDSAFDQNRQGVVYTFSAANGTVGAPIPLSPVLDTGFVDSNGATTGCFPNQLYAAAISNGRVYVTGVCASPRGPVGPAGTNAANFKTELHAALFVVDLETKTEKQAETVLLTREFQDLYDGAMVPDDASRRIPLIANDLAFVPGATVGYLTAYGSDAVFRVRFNANGTLGEVGSAAQRFIELAPNGRLPLGIAISQDGHAIVLNEFTRNLSIITFAVQAAEMGTTPSADAPAGAADAINKGRRLFVTGTGRWSLRGQAWNSCEACHPDGLTDNVTWFFGRGPRQTTSLDGTYDPAGERRLLNWTGIFDEVHDFELNTRGNSGGIGAIVHATPMPPSVADRIVFDGAMPATGQVPTATRQDGLNGSTRSMMPDGATTPKSVLNDWNEIDAYVKTIRPPRKPLTLNAADVTAGRALFIAGNCAGCHGGPNWTISRVFYTPNEANNTNLSGKLINQTYARPMMFPATLNPASMSGSATLRLSPFSPANDQINCVVRAVGTFPAALDGQKTGVMVMNGNRVKEVRADMTTNAQGATGFNPPSLVGMSTGAPYFHAGNARTLEEVFDETFTSHYQAFNVNFLLGANRETEIRQLTAFLLSIDESTMETSVQGSLPYDPVLCPQTF